VLVEGSCEVAFQQLVVEDGLGNDAADKLEITQMIGVAVRCRVDGVRHSVSGRRTEQSIHRVEDLTRYDDVPLTQQSAGVLTFLACKQSTTFLAQTKLACYSVVIILVNGKYFHLQLNYNSMMQQHLNSQKYKIH